MAYKAKHGVSKNACLFLLLVTVGLVAVYIYFHDYSVMNLSAAQLSYTQLHTSNYSIIELSYYPSYTPSYYPSYTPSYTTSYSPSYSPTNTPSHNPSAAPIQSVIEYDSIEKAKFANDTYDIETITNYNGNNCHFYLIYDGYKAFFHQFTCLLVTLFQNYSCLKILNGQNNLQIITGSSYKTPDFIQEIFFSDNNSNIRHYYHDNIRDITPYFCTKDKNSPWKYPHSNETSKEFYILWHQYISHKLKITMDTNTYNNYTKKKSNNNILIIDRMRGKRKLKNAKQLKKYLEKDNKFQVNIVYNEKLKYKDQIQLILEQPKYIITPHGSNMANLMNLNYIHDNLTTIIIEVCPPYTHCKCCRICGSFEPYLHPINRNYFGYIEQDRRMDCTQFCDYYHKNKTSADLRGYIRDVRFVRINIAYLERVIMADVNRTKATLFNGHYIYVHKYNFDPSMLRFYQNPLFIYKQKWINRRKVKKKKSSIAGKSLT